MPAPVIAKKKILVVDDEPFVCDAVKMMLAFDGHEVQTANSAQEALQLFDEHQFDLVITDQMMPGMTGVQLATQLASLQPQLPVILYTGFNEGITQAEIEAAHLRAVATKPIEPHQLFGLLRTHLPSAQ